MGIALLVLREERVFQPFGNNYSDAEGQLTKGGILSIDAQTWPRLDGASGEGRAGPRPGGTKTPPQKLPGVLAGHEPKKGRKRGAHQDGLITGGVRSLMLAQPLEM